MDPPFQQAASQSSTAGSFPRLEVLDPATPHTFSTPSKQINDGPDVARFLTSKAYRDIGTFVLQLNRALCPRKGDGGPSKTFPLGVKRSESESIRKLQLLLEKAGSFIEEAPPDPGPRRFGNVSFRTWHKLLEERATSLLEEYLPSEILQFPATSRETSRDDEASSSEGAIDELKSYFLGSFGSSQRLDYGTGHELSFLAFLGCLWKLGAFKNEAQDGEIERSIVLEVFEPYLKVVRRLILTYTLEPAGSHGVWGLDDHSFMPYIFGSAQLTRPITESESMPLEGSVERAPRPSDVTKPASVERLREVNMYFSAIGFINDVKKGPFWEHSPILFDISGIKDGWGKINKGMIKMFNAEVLSKFPVVQHFPFGSLFSWEQDPNAATPQQTIHMANQPTTMPGPAAGAGTAAPWSQATQMPGPAGPGVPYSRAPWASSGTGSNAPSMTTRPPPPTQPTGLPGTAGAQITMTRAPWARGEPGSG